jgi:hypothetical protein
MNVMPETAIIFGWWPMNAYQIAKYYTLEQIDAKIAEYQSAADGAITGSYSLDTTQGRQSVTPSDPDKVMKYLALWLKAREIKAGTYTGAQLIRVNYTP